MRSSSWLKSVREEVNVPKEGDADNDDDDDGSIKEEEEEEAEEKDIEEEGDSVAHEAKSARRGRKNGEAKARERQNFELWIKWMRIRSTKRGRQSGTKRDEEEKGAVQSS